MAQKRAALLEKRMRREKESQQKKMQLEAELEQKKEEARCVRLRKKINLFVEILFDALLESFSYFFLKFFVSILYYLPCIFFILSIYETSQDSNSNVTAF